MKIPNYLVQGTTLTVFLIGNILNAFVQDITLVNYSTVLLLAAVIAFFSRNAVLLLVLFVVGAYAEILWLLQFTSQFVFHTHIPSVPHVLFQPENPLLDLVVSSYHFILLPLLLHAIYTTKHVFTKEWKLSF